MSDVTLQAEQSLLCWSDQHSRVMNSVTLQNKDTMFRYQVTLLERMKEKIHSYLDKNQGLALERYRINGPLLLAALLCAKNRWPYLELAIT